MNVFVQKLNPNASLPSFGTDSAAGADLYALLDAPVSIPPASSFFVHTGIALEIPSGHVGLIFARSGLSCKRDLAPANKVGVIDSDYRGEIIVCLHNHGFSPQTIAPNDRIAQIIILPIPPISYVLKDSLSSTDRAEKGFGSTGS